MTFSSLLEECLASSTPAPITTPAARPAARPGHGEVPGVSRPLTDCHFHGTDSFAVDGALAGVRTVDELCARAGLGWSVSAQRFATERGARSGDLRAIVREDTGLVMSVRSDAFAIAQNAEVFSPLQPLVEAGATFRGAGSFREGRTVWAQVNLAAAEVIPGDRVALFAHVRDSRDGAHCWTLQVGSVRIVCANTLLHACEAGGMLSRARHGRQYRATIEDARRALSELRGTAEGIVEQYRRLARWEIRRDDVREMLGAALPKPATDDAKKAAAIAERQTEEVLAMVGGRQRGAYSIEGVLGTAWGALNGVTDWADHVLAPSRASDPAAVLRKVTEGNAARVKELAFDWLVAHAPS